MGIAGEIINIIGGTVRYVYGKIRRLFIKAKKYSYREYLFGADDPEDWFEEKGHTFINKIVGMVSLVLLLYFINRLYTYFEYKK